MKWQWLTEDRPGSEWYSLGIPAMIWGAGLGVVCVGELAHRRGRIVWWEIAIPTLVTIGFSIFAIIDQRRLGNDRAPWWYVAVWVSVVAVTALALVLEAG